MIGTPASENQPLCFVLMPFGSKPDPAGGPDIDFNRIYEKAIKPGIQAADMFPVRADEEKLGSIIHKAMFEPAADLRVRGRRSDHGQPECDV